MGSLSNLYISQSYQSLIHLATNNTASATLIGLEDGLGNSIGVSVNTAGNLFLSGTFSASLQEGYLYVGNASGRTIAFPTSSLVTNINTGSLVTTSSFNAYTASTNIRLSNIELTTASVLVSIANLNASSASQQISIDALNAFSASQIIVDNAFNQSITNLNTFTQSADIRLNNLESTSASVNTSIANINQYTQSNDAKWQDLGNKSGSWITESETGSFARYDVSNPWSADQTFTNITAFSASFTYVKTIFETASVIYSSGSNQLGDELTDVQTLSGSVLVRGGLFVNDIDVTSSLNSINVFTQSANIRLNNLETTSASVNISISNLNTFTASISTASIVNSITNLNQFTQSANQRLGSLEAATSSYAISSSVAAVDAAQQAQINSLINATGSYVTETESGSFLITASFDNGTRNLTFTKGNASTFDVNIPGISGSTIDTGSFATTGSNTFTGQNIFNENVIIGNAKQLTFTTQNDGNGDYGHFNYYNGPLNNYGQSSQWEAGASANGILFISATNPTYGIYGINLNGNVFLNGNQNISGSLTASLQQGYVWVGDASGITTTVATSSFGSTIDTGSFVTTSSFNAYTQSTDNRLTNIENTTASLNTSITNINSFTQSANQRLTAIETVSGSWITESESGSFLITGSVAGNVLTFTKGDNTTFNLTVATGSGGGGSTDTGSLLVTASFNAGTITFTKGDGSTFPLSSFATLGANQFTGSQEILNNSQLIFGNGFSLRGNATDIAQISAQTSIQFITEPPAGPGGANDIKFINRVSGSQIIFQNDQAGAGNNITFAGGDILFNVVAVSGSSQKVRFGNNPSNSPISIDASNSTFTASLQSGYIWVGNASNVSTATQLSSLVPIFSNPNLNTHSSSLYLIANTFNSGAANFAHISASAQNQANLIFKNNNNAGSTIISGSNNIFTNPAAPAAGRINYIGGGGNMFLNSTVQQLPTITGSAASVSGTRASMNQNLIVGAQGWAINQAANTGTHTYNNNLFVGSGTHAFNFSGNTAATIGVSNNMTINGTFNLNSPSRSLAQIAAGASGSNAISITGNALFNGTLNYNGPVSSSAHNINGNQLAGGILNFNVQSQSRNITSQNNIIAGTLTINDNTVFAPTLGSVSSYTGNIINGTTNITNRFSASIQFNNNNSNLWQINNDADLSAISTVAQRIIQIGGNALFGITGNNIYFSGSAGGTVIKPMLSNLMTGNFISASVIYTGGGEQALLATAVLGHGLTVFGTSQFNASSQQAGGQNAGAAFVGRWNAIDGNRAGTAETIFAVGTGTSGSTGITRKTGFLIDSGSNTFVEGTLNVSGSSTLSGSLYIQSGSTLPVSTGSAILTWNAATGQVNQASYSTIISASVSSGEFWSTTTQSGSAGVSGSITFNNSGSFYNISVVNGTQLQVANAGVYNIQFSAQVETSAGADTLWIWFKKNGNNISDSASKVVLANNTAQIMTVNILDQAVANDYYEIAYQNLNGHATVLAEVASGNIPAIPSVIATIFQIR